MKVWAEAVTRVRWRGQAHAHAQGPFEPRFTHPCKAHAPPAHPPTIPPRPRHSTPAVGSRLACRSSESPPAGLAMPRGGRGGVPQEAAVRAPRAAAASCTHAPPRTTQQLPCGAQQDLPQRTPLATSTRKTSSRVPGAGACTRESCGSCALGTCRPPSRATCQDRESHVVRARGVPRLRRGVAT
jgi:hypothetical protein